MLDDLNLRAVLKLVGVFIAALLVINAFEYAIERAADGDITRAEGVGIAVVVVAILAALLVVQLRKKSDRWQNI